MQVDDPEEARRVKAKGGKLIEGGSRVVSPTGRHTLNMSRALGGAPPSRLSANPDPFDDQSVLSTRVLTMLAPEQMRLSMVSGEAASRHCSLLQGSSRRGALLMRAPHK